MKKRIVIFIILIISVFFISCDSVAANSKFSSGMLILPNEQADYEWEYVLSDSSIKINEFEIPLINDFIYEIKPTRNGIFRIVFNYKNISTNMITHVASYNIEVNKNKIYIIDENYKEIKNDKYKDKKAIHLSIIGEQENE